MSSDLDECDPNNAAEKDERPRCQHFCHNYVGGYFCSCRTGYQLQSDHHSCKGKLEFWKIRGFQGRSPSARKGGRSDWGSSWQGCRQHSSAKWPLLSSSTPQWSAAVSCSQRHLGTWAALSTPSLILKTSGVTTASVCKRACLSSSSSWNPLRLKNTSKSTVLMTSSRYWRLANSTSNPAARPGWKSWGHHYSDEKYGISTRRMPQHEGLSSSLVPPSVCLITIVPRSEALGHRPLWVKPKKSSFFQFYLPLI